MMHITAWPGEFGLKLYSYVPQVHTICLREPCRVDMEEGEEALFPAAEERRFVPRPADSTRHGPPPDLGVEPTRFVPEPHEPQDVGPSDVVVCPRWREYGEEKNWYGWRNLVVHLLDRGLTVHAAGAPDSSADVPVARKAWEYDRFLDASIAMMRNTDLVVATDAGLAHLAVLCGVDLLVVTYRGTVAPGPVVDSSGRVAQQHYWAAGYGPQGTVDRFEAANHTGARIERVDGWERPDMVAKRIAVMLDRKVAA